MKSSESTEDPTKVNTEDGAKPSSSSKKLKSCCKSTKDVVTNVAQGVSKGVSYVAHTLMTQEQIELLIKGVKDGVRAVVLDEMKSYIGTSDGMVSTVTEHVIKALNQEHHEEEISGTPVTKSTMKNVKSGNSSDNASGNSTVLNNYMERLILKQIEKASNEGDITLKINAIVEKKVLAILSAKGFKESFVEAHNSEQVFSDTKETNSGNSTTNKKGPTKKVKSGNNPDYEYGNSTTDKKITIDENTSPQKQVPFIGADSGGTSM